MAQYKVETNFFQQIQKTPSIVIVFLREEEKA